jgi:hypothetical protein
MGISTSMNANMWKEISKNVNEREYLSGFSIQSIPVTL